MRQRRRFKTQLACGGVLAVLFTVLAYRDLIKDVTRESKEIIRERSGRHHKQFNVPVRKTVKQNVFILRTNILFDDCLKTTYKNKQMLLVAAPPDP